MRTQRSAVVIALALLVGASTAGATAPSCVPAGSMTLRASGAARIYSQGAALLGCLGARRTRLGSLHGSVPFPAHRVLRYALSPRYAGVDTVDMGVDTLASSVTLIDLRTGATLATAPATTPERRPESFVTVSSIAVNATGTLAWIGQRSAIGALTPIYEVHTLSASGARLLATAADIKPKSLRLLANSVTWQAGGHTHTATI